MKKEEKIRVRFAPAPTGKLHIGGARTALFNYLFARKHQGTFLLRIEDTDKERSKPEYEKDILENLKWLGIFWDEKILYQSKRLPIYKKSLEKLLAEEKCYYCFCSKEELKVLKEEQLSIGKPPVYSGKCRRLTKKEIEKKLKEKNRSFLIRLKVPSQVLKFKDLIRGEVKFNTQLLGDFSLAIVENEEIRPLYNLAAVIDDFETNISYVIRGEDHLPNTPKQILIQKALGFYQPKYAHLPLILGPDRSKLSKRHGAVSISDFREQGYLPEALINFMAFLGWNPGTEREIFSINSLIKEFSLERVQKSAAIFNLKRLEFLNSFYLKQKSPEELLKISLPYLIEANLIEPAFEKERKYFSIPDSKELLPSWKVKQSQELIELEKLKKIISLYQERLKKLSEIPDLINFFFLEKINYEKSLLSWGGMKDQEVKNILEKGKKILEKIKEKDWNQEKLKEILIKEADRIGDRGKVLWPLRVALTGKEASAPFFQIAEILGKEKTLKRTKEAINKLKI